MGFFSDLFKPKLAPSSPQNSNLRILGNIKHLETDLVESSDIAACCPKCAMYRRRIYSLSGRNKKFPKIPDDFDSNCCGLNLFPYILGVFEPAFSCKNPVQYSNRPFVDDRTQKEKKAYHDLQEELERLHQKELDRKIYEKLLITLPNDTPKSFGAFRRMKSTNSKGYQELRIKARARGINL